MRIDWLSIPEVYALVDENGHAIMADPQFGQLKRRACKGFRMEGDRQKVAEVKAMKKPEKLLSARKWRGSIGAGC